MCELSREFHSCTPLIDKLILFIFYVQTFE